MSIRQKGIWTTALGLHLFLVVVISLQDVSSTLIVGHYPPWFERALARTEAIASSIRGQGLSESNPLRQSLGTYANCSGIEVGYSYFAPIIPGNCKLVFELHYPDGRVEYDLPVVGGSAAGYRVSALLDYLQVIQDPPLREALLRSLAESVRREHPTLRSFERSWEWQISSVPMSIGRGREFLTGRCLLTTSVFILRRPLRLCPK